jgi:hypothetical protein
MHISMKEERKRNLMNNLIKGLLLVSTLFSQSFFDYATIYASTSLNSAKVQEFEDDYKISLGLRKIARFPYQEKSDFYSGEEISITDRASIGFVPKWEYLANFSQVRERGDEFIDMNFFLRYLADNFLVKLEYIEKESRKLKLAQFDLRGRFKVGNTNITSGLATRLHPAYGVDPYGEGWYEGEWYQLAYDQGYIDGSYVVGDLNENNEVDSYYIWIETDEYTGEGYWIFYQEGINYYWQDPEGNHIASSDEEFMQYYMPEIINQYNIHEIDKLGWQSELSLVIGIDNFINKKNYYIHSWLNAYPLSLGLTEYSYGDSKNISYDIGIIAGFKISKRVGVFLEGIYLNYYDKKEHSIKSGINVRF